MEIDLGDDGPLNTTLGEYVNSNTWFNLTISHRHNVINVTLNELTKMLRIKGSTNYLYIDPEIYIGGGPELHKKKGELEIHNVVGIIRKIYIFFFVSFLKIGWKIFLIVNYFSKN